MKKLSVIALVASLFFFSLTSVSAMSEADLKAKFEGTLTLNGEKYGLAGSVITYVERYLNQYDVNSTDADFIAKRVDKAKKIIEKDGHAVFEDFSSDTKQQLRTLVDEIVAETSVKARLESGAVIILNSDGSVFTEVTELVKQTGVETSYTALIASISLIIVAAGTCLIVRQVKTSK